MKLQRRRFLQLSGVGAAAASVLPAHARAQTAGATPPMRLLILYAEGGTRAPETFMRPPWAPAEWNTYNPWDPAQSNKADDLEWEFDLTDSRLTQDHFSAVLKPLFRHRKKMMVLEGVNMLSTAWDTEGGDGHAQGHVAALCGSAGRKYDGVKAVAVTPSIDQVISDFLRRTDPAHQSLDFRPSARRVRDEYFHEWLFKADSTGQVTRLPVEVNPETAYRRLFGTSTTGTDPRSAARRNLLSLIRDQYRAVGNQVGAADRVKLDKHRQMIEDLQSSLGVVRSCDRRTPPATVTIPNGLSGAEIADIWRKDLFSFADVVAMSFACNISRVATIGSITAPNELYGLATGVSIHHAYEHPSDPFLLLGTYKGNRSAVVGAGDGEGSVYGDLVDMMVKRNVTQVDMVAQILDRLDAIPEGTGTLLDHTVVMYVSELSHGNHGHEHWPMMLFGGGATGALKQGRYLKYAQNNPNPWSRNYRNAYVGAPHNRVLVHLCKSMGMDIDFIHKPSIDGTYPMRKTISMSGSLPRLTG
jgi:hypothetical protein